MQAPAYLLDLDGTLTDPYPGISLCIAHALIQMGFPVPADEDMRAWIGPPLKRSFEQYFEPLGGGNADEAVALYRERFSSEGLYENSVYPGIPELLEALKDHGGRLMLATSKPAVFARRIVGHFGMQRWLDGVYGSELDGRMADKVELLAHIIECEGLFPDNCIMVGDREHDVRAARYHGMEAVGVLWGYGTPVELLEAGAGTLVSSPGELLEVLLSSGR